MSDLDSERCSSLAPACIVKMKENLGDIFFLFSFRTSQQFPENQQVISKTLHYWAPAPCMHTDIVVSDWQRHMASLIIKNKPHNKVSLQCLNAAICCPPIKNAVCFHDAGVVNMNQEGSRDKHGDIGYVQLAHNKTDVLFRCPLRSDASCTHTSSVSRTSFLQETSSAVRPRTTRGY